MQNKKAKKKTVAVCAALVGVLAVGGLSAYFTDTDSATNKFVIGEVDIDLTEPNWINATQPDTNDNKIPDVAEGIVPNQEIAKDPTVTLKTGSVESYVFLEVKIPKVSDNGTPTELFKMLKTDGNPGVNAKWTVLTDKGDTTDADYNTYVYAYDDTLKAGDSTATLFDKVKVENISDQKNIKGEKQIDVKAYAIQADNLGKTDKGDIWDILKNSISD